MKAGRIALSCTLVIEFVASGSFAAWGPERMVIDAQVQKGDFIEANTFQAIAVCSDADFSVGGCCLFDADPSNCGDGGADEVFAAGDIPAMSTYWNEGVDCGTYDCRNYQVLWSLAIAPSNLVFLFQNELISFGDVSGFDGAEVTFCVFSGLELPPSVAGLNLAWGFWVETPADSCQIGTTDILDITGAGACTPYAVPLADPSRKWPVSLGSRDKATPVVAKEGSQRVLLKNQPECVPSPEPQTFCLNFRDYCDALEVVEDPDGIHFSGWWRNYDCAGSDEEILGGRDPAWLMPSPCGGNGDTALACKESDGCFVGGAGESWSFISDTFLDGTIDMGIILGGAPMPGSCWINELAYEYTSGSCPQLLPGGVPSSEAQRRFMLQ